MKHLTFLLFLMTLTSSAYSRKDTIYLEPNIRIVHKHLAWRQLYMQDIYLPKKNKAKFITSPFLFPGSGNYYLGYFHGNGGTVSVQSGYLAEFTHDFESDEAISTPLHLQKFGNYSSTEADTSSEILNRKNFYLDGKKYELLKKRNWFKPRKQKKNKEIKLRFYDSFEAVFDTTFQNTSYLHIEWQSTDSFLDLKRMIRSFSNIKEIPGTVIDSIHISRMNAPAFQVAINGELKTWKTGFEKNTRSKLQCLSAISIDETAMHQIPLDTIQNHLDNFDYEGLASRIIQVYENYTANILEKQNQFEKQYGYSKALEMDRYQKLWAGKVPISDLLNELTNEPIENTLDTLKILDLMESTTIHDMMFSDFYAGDHFETAGKKSYKHKLEDLISRQFAIQNLGYRDQSILSAHLMNDGPDFRNYCYYIQKTDQPEEDDIYIVSFRKDSLHQWTSNFISITFDPFQTGNNTLIPCTGGYFLPGNMQSVILETDRNDLKISLLKRDNTSADQFPTLIEVQASEMPNNEPDILSISHQHIETLSDTQRQYIQQLIESEIKEDPEFFQFYDKDTLYILRKNSDEINTWIQANQKLYRQNFYLNDINRDGREDIIQYDVVNGILISWSAYTLQDNAYVRMPEMESKMLLEEVSDVRNLLLFSQLSFSPQSSKP